MEESGRHYVGQKTEETTKRKSVGSQRGTSLYIQVGTLALTKRQEEKMQIAENNWVRRICKVTQEDRMKMKELREAIGMKKHLKMKIVRSRMRWAGHVQRMGEDRLSKRA